jgi:hypothetical protein
MLLHRRPEDRGGGEILSRRQGLVVKHQGQVVGQGACQRLPRRLVDGLAEVDARDLGPERGVKGRDP